MFLAPGAMLFIATACGHATRGTVRSGPREFERLKKEVSLRIEQSYSKVERTKRMLEVAAEVVKPRTQGERMPENQLTQGVVLVSARRHVSAASYKARVERLQTQLAQMPARAELKQKIRRTPGG